MGHVFQGHYHAILVAKDKYLLELARYSVLNPVHAGRVKAVSAYLWSSYRTTAGTGSGRAWLHTDWLLSQFHRLWSRAQRRYREFVRAGQGNPDPWEQVTGKVILGDSEFVRYTRNRVRGKKLIEIPRQQCFAGRPALKTLFADGTQRTKAQRNALIRRAHREYGYALGRLRIR